MSISVSCESCDKQLKVKDEYAGKKLKCPGCAAPIRVPGGEPSKPVTKSARKPVTKAVPRPARKPEPEPELEIKLELKKDVEAREKNDESATGDLDVGEKKSLARKKPLAPDRRSGVRPTTSSGGSSIWGNVFAIRLLLGGVLAIVGLIVSHFNGSAAYDAHFNKVQAGSARTEVISEMGTPELTEHDGPRELLAYHATDSTGRYSEKNTYYVFVLENGRVLDKKRLTEAELDALGK